MFTLAKNSLAFEVKERKYGLQDKGVSPKGASDQLSFEVAKILLNNPENYLCYEIIFTSKVCFTKDCTFTLTGAHYKETFLQYKDQTLKIEHACVYKAKAGSTLSYEHLQEGFRLYLMASTDTKSTKNEGRQRGKLSSYFSLPSKKIRLIQGPEYHYLKEPNSFENMSFKISKDSNLIGLRLTSKHIEASRYDIISAAVNDGTIQLTKDGAIVLLRHRQTTGGYPRVFSVISADIDTLAQYQLGESVHFKCITMKEAKELLKQNQKELQNFKSSFQNQ